MISFVSLFILTFICFIRKGNTLNEIQIPCPFFSINNYSDFAHSKCPCSIGYLCSGQVLSIDNCNNCMGTPNFALSDGFTNWPIYSGNCSSCNNLSYLVPWSQGCRSTIIIQSCSAQSFCQSQIIVSVNSPNRRMMDYLEEVSISSLRPRRLSSSYQCDDQPSSQSLRVLGRQWVIFIVISGGIPLIYILYKLYERVEKRRVAVSVMPVESLITTPTYVQPNHVRPIATSNSVTSAIASDPGIQAVPIGGVIAPSTPRAVPFAYPAHSPMTPLPYAGVHFPGYTPAPESRLIEGPETPDFSRHYIRSGG